MSVTHPQLFCLEPYFSDTVTRTERLEKVEHVLASSTGILDFAVEGENEYHTWSGSEEAD
jgi:hypothetical protein